MKPKLLYIAPQNSYPPVDGGKIGIYYPLVYMTRYFDVYFAFPYSNPSISLRDIEEHFAIRKIKVLPFPHNTKQDVKYLLKNFFKKVPFKWNKYYSKYFQKEIEKLIIQENINLIWISAPHMARYAIEVRRKFPKIKIFLREHNIEFKLIEQFKDYTKNLIYKIISLWQLKKAKRLETEYWRLFDKTFFISDLDYAIAKELMPDICDKFVVLYDGYNIVISEPLVPQDNSFIYTANLKTIQNSISFKWFIKSIWIPNLDKLKEMNTKLYITGNEEKVVTQILGFKNIRDYNIINLGFVKDINKTILSHKYVLSPTIIGSGIRLKILNGMACGKPVFLTPLDLSTCSVFKDMDNVVCFKTKNEFLKKLITLERNAELYLKISKRAIERIRVFFNWSKYAEKVYKIISEEV